MDNDFDGGIGVLCQHRFDAVGKQPLAVVIGDADTDDGLLGPAYHRVLNHCHV